MSHFSLRALALTLLSGAILPSLLSANPAHGDPRLEKLFSQFMSPCCWRENLLAHQSPKAGELRDGIVRRIAAGESDEQIKAAMIAEYSSRILALPEGSKRHWLSWTPLVATAGGLLLLISFLRRSLRASPMPDLMAPLLPQAPETEWDR